MISSRARPKPPSPLKTYSHLATERRMPTEYEVVTTNLHYYGKTGFAVNVPLGPWYERHQGGSPFVCDDWERFADPDGTTYTRYVATRRDRELHVDGVLRSIDSGDYDRALSPSWRSVLERAVMPLRYPWHGLQMISAYVGQMAPSGRITIAAALQAADEVRRIQRIAYRMVQLGQIEPGFGERSRELWQDDPLWQPLRELVERMLVAYDWGEAFVALNLCAKPVLDELFLARLPALARAREDSALGAIFFSLREDAAWSRAWTACLVRTALASRPENKAVLEGWIQTWAPRALRAAEPFEQYLEAPGTCDALAAFQRASLGALGLEVQ